METKLCRICGKLGQNFVHIFKTEGLRDKIETCLPIIVSPHCLLPDTMCGDCTENVENFYSFMKNCLQNIIILEAQYDVQESCLKSKRKKEKGCYANFTHKKDNRGVQTDDYLDVITGRHSDLEEYTLNFPLITKFLETDKFKAKPTTCLVDYDVDSDSNLDDKEENNGKVVLGEKLESLNRINKFVDSVILGKNSIVAKKHYFDDTENNLISEISQRKNLKRKGDTIENRQPKIFKMDTSNRRKNKQPKKLDAVVTDVLEKAGFGVNRLEKSDLLSTEIDNQQVVSV